MDKFIFIVLLVFLVGFIIYVTVKHFTTKSLLLNSFRTGNTITGGKIGYGKDLLEQFIVHDRKSIYFGNIDYGGDYKYLDPKELELNPNTYNNFIKGDVTIVKKNELLEGHDIYFSDGGVIFPSQMDSYLHKTYPSLPIAYALSRQLWNNHIHVNTQQFERVWKALREQADTYILIRKPCLKLPFCFVVYTRVYDKYESAKYGLAPLGSRLFNKYSKAERDKYIATNGQIKDGFIIIPKWYVKYDTRAFHKKLFGEVSPTTKKKEKK